MVSYVLWGAAGLHPSMPHLAEPAPTREDVLLTRMRLVLLTAASLIAPLISGMHHVRARELEFLVVDAASIALFGLVIARMVGPRPPPARARRGAAPPQRRGALRRARAPRDRPDHRASTPGGEVIYSSPSVRRILGEDTVAAFADLRDRQRIVDSITVVAGGEDVAPFECTLIDRRRRAARCSRCGSRT